jgi:site-specific DNA recombinase
MRKSEQHPPGATVRCAIYTRKSSDDGLEQAFNSLDAQREACAAYIVSQRHAGWGRFPISTTTADSRVAPWSGRPCSGCADIKAGKVRIVVASH